MNTATLYAEFRGGDANRKHTASLSARTLACLRTWIERSRGRANLRELDERLLQDIGARQADALHEARKPFWKP